MASTTLAVRPWAAALRPARAALVTLALVLAGLALLASTVGLGHGGTHEHAGLPATERIGDLELTVHRFARLADGHAGTNSPKLPMSGPAMPMVGAGHIADAVHTGQERVAVGVMLRNTGDEAMAYDALDFLLLAGGRPAELVGPMQSTLGAGTLPPGARIAGEVYFSIKDGTDDLAVRHVRSRRATPLSDDAHAGGGAHAH